jgi:hypothetical protein
LKGIFSNSVPEFGDKGTPVAKVLDHEAHAEPLVLLDTELSIFKAC